VSPVITLGIQGQAAGLTGNVKLKAGSGVALSYDLPNNAIVIDGTAGGLPQTSIVGPFNAPEASGLTLDHISV